MAVTLKPKKQKFIVVLSVETREELLTKRQIREFIESELGVPADYFGMPVRKVRIRTVDLD